MMQDARHEIPGHDGNSGSYVRKLSPISPIPSTDVITDVPKAELRTV